jgi:hypothetical protein
LSFCVGLFSTIPVEEMNGGDYRWMMFGIPEFRKHAALVMADQGINLNVSIPGIAAPFDMHAVLVQDLDIDTVGPKFTCIWDGPYETCSEDFKQVDQIVSYTVDKFPVDFMRLWLSMNRDKWMVDGDVPRLSDKIVQFGGIATSSLCIPMLISVLMYSALAFTPIRELLNHSSEEEQQRGAAMLTKFNQLAGPLIIIGEISLSVGLVFFFIGLTNVVRLRTPNWSSVQDYRRTYFTYGLWPVAITICILTAASFIHGGGLSEWCQADHSDEERPAKDAALTVPVK